MESRETPKLKESLPDQMNSFPRLVNSANMPHPLQEEETG